LAERLEIVRTGFRYGALPDPATGRGHRDVQATQLLGGGVQDLLGGLEVGDVDRIEVAVDPGRDLLAVRSLAVENRDAGTTGMQQLGAGAAHARGTADHDDLLPLISIQTSLFVRAVPAQ